MTNKKYITGLVAAALGLGIIAASPAVQAAPTQQPLDYINGATNEYSFRMKEEDRVHEQNVRKIRFEFQRDGNQEKEEQKRHDQEVKNIKRDYDKRTPWRR